MVTQVKFSLEAVRLLPDRGEREPRALTRPTSAVAQQHERYRRIYTYLYPALATRQTACLGASLDLFLVPATGHCARVHRVLWDRVAYHAVLPIRRVRWHRRSRCLVLHETWVVRWRIHWCAVELASGYVLVLRLHAAVSFEVLYRGQAHSSCAAWRATKVGCLLLLLLRWWGLVAVGRGVVVLLLLLLLLARLVLVRRDILHGRRRRRLRRRRQRLLVRSGTRSSTARALRRTLVVLILLHGCGRVPRGRHLRGSRFHALAHTRFLLRRRANLARLSRGAAPSL